jgi:hypothetical protein
MVALGSEDGLLVSNGEIGRVMWIDTNGVLIDVSGPSVTPDQVLALASDIVASSSKAG